MSLPICKFFRSEQGCKFGNKCRYKHSDQFSPPQTLSSVYQNQHEGSVNKSFYSSETSSRPQEHNFAATKENEVSLRNQDVGHHCSQISSYIRSTLGDNNEGPVSSAVSLGISYAQLQEQFQGLEAAGHDEQAVTSRPEPNPLQKPARKLCRYYSSNGYCCFGSRCRFEHSRSYRTPPRFQRDKDDPRVSGALADEKLQDSKPEEGQGVRHRGNNNERNFSSYPTDESVHLDLAGSALSARHTDQDQEGTEHQFALTKQQTSTDKVCQFYLTGRCWRGKRCKFLHPGHLTEFRVKPSAAKEHGDENSQEDQGERCSSSHKPAYKPAERSATAQSNCKEAPHKSSSNQPRTPYVAQGVKKYRREEVDDVEGSRLRRTEIDQLVKRFPKSKVKVNRDCAEYFQCVISFNPTDPDWVRN